MSNYIYFLIPWEPSIVVIAVFTVIVILYIRGSAVCQASIGQKICFWLGLALLYIASQTQFDYYAEHEFFMHRIQHDVLHHTGPFLIVLARPGNILMAGMPPMLQQRLAVVTESGAWKNITGALNHPAFAVTLFCGLIFLWLIPQLHFVAMLDWRIYRIMNWGMAINGLMFWSLVLNNFSLRGANLTPFVRIMMLLAIIPPQIIIGMLIFVAPGELYPVYSICGRAFSLSPLADQQLGGLILWVPAVMMSVIGILVLAKKELLTD